ncbi:hypothetical protein [Aequorivita marina]|uniref:hypothetical protein n=1 Tax=Aequorivita marina TaxID=3073654 RepID=UPI00287461DB|nr:hypothetical protein [Aequorivita sp. S2608]MDS1297703.1 hypothetical protein [Aequorivita sp. S2608]
MQIKSLFFILVIFQLAGCQSNKNGNTKELNKNGYSISYPSDLTLDESGVNSSEFILSTEKTDTTDNFVENINLVIQNFTDRDIDLNTFVEISVDQINSRGKLISNERFKKGDAIFQRLVYTITINKLNLKFIQYYFLENNKAYILTFTSEEDVFDKYSAEMEEIMQSFKLN